MIIKKVIDTFRDLAREHNLVRSFAYSSLSKGKGTGEQKYPQVFLEDPMIINDSSVQDGTVRLFVNFDVTMLPQAFDNNEFYKLDVDKCQDLSHEIALNMLVKIRNDSKDYEKRNGIEVVKYNFMTLRNWGDDDAAGVRCSVTLKVDSGLMLCDTDLHFNPEKQFELDERLSEFSTDDSSSCYEDYSYKLKKFDV